jgi:hypothetical protein
MTSQIKIVSAITSTEENFTSKWYCWWDRVNYCTKLKDEFLCPLMKYQMKIVYSEQQAAELRHRDTGQWIHGILDIHPWYQRICGGTAGEDVPGGGGLWRRLCTGEIRDRMLWWGNCIEKSGTTKMKYRETVQIRVTLLSWNTEELYTEEWHYYDEIQRNCLDNSKVRLHYQAYRCRQLCGSEGCENSSRHRSYPQKEKALL